MRVAQIWPKSKTTRQANNSNILEADKPPVGCTRNEQKFAVKRPVPASQTQKAAAAATPIAALHLLLRTQVAVCWTH